MGWRRELECGNDGQYCLGKLVPYPESGESRESGRDVMSVQTALTVRYVHENGCV